MLVYDSNNSKLISAIIFVLLFISLLFAFPVKAEEQIKTTATNKSISVEGKKNRLKFSFGKREDELIWRIGDENLGTNGFVVSELEWRDVKSNFLLLEGSHVLSREIVAKWSVGFGDKYAGKNRDSDYCQSAYRDETSRSENSAKRGSIEEFSLALGYLLLSDAKVDLHLNLGFNTYKNEYTMTDLNQVVSVTFANCRLRNENNTGPFVPLGVGRYSGLNSTYTTEFSGLWTGFSLALKPSQHITVNLSGSYYFENKYTGDGYWNLRGLNGLNFKQSADATGWRLDADSVVTLDNRVDIGVGVHYQRWSIGSGTDIENDNGVIGVGFFRDGEWTSTSFDLFLRMLF